MALVTYLSFLKNNKLNELTSVNVRLYKTKDIPLLRLLPNLTEEQIYEGTRRGDARKIA